MSARYQNREMVFAILSVAGATEACSTHGDAAAVETLTRYYALVDDSVRRASGRVIKVIGDGVIVAFPMADARDAAANLRSLQQDSTNLWRLFDQRCRLQVKVGTGSVISGLLGPPGQEREDIYGDALNQLFRLPSGDFVMSAAMKELVSSE